MWNSAMEWLGNRVSSSDKGKRRQRNAAVLLLLVLPVSVIGAYSYIHSREELSAGIYARRQSVAFLAASTLREKLDQLKQIGTSLTTRPRVYQLISEGKWNDAVEFLRRVPKDFPFIDRLFLTEPDAEVRDMTDKPVEILLVEDNPNDVELTLHALKENHLANYIEVVRDGAEALDFIFYAGAYARRPADQHPKVILLDLKLPKVDGLEVLKRLKSDARTRMIPVVVLTSSREERDIVESYRLGVNSYIVKPVDFEQFTEAVRNLGLYWLLLNQPPTV